MNELFEPSRVVHEDIVPGARYWSFIIRRGFSLRLTDIHGGANASVLMYNAAQPLERYNMADTFKIQHVACLNRGNVCYSDMGRVLMSITDDSCGDHDSFTGVSNDKQVLEQYGEARYQEHRNAFYRSGRELFLIELNKWGLGEKDIVPNINFFSKIAVNEDGDFAYVEGHSQAGQYLDLRAEMDTLVVMNTCPNPLQPGNEWKPRPVKVSIWKNDPLADNDECMNFCEENQRGFANTAIYLCQY